MTRVWIGLFAMFLSAASLSGQQEGLYGSKAPEDAAFVRILNSGTSSLPPVPVGATRFERLSPGDVSPYRVLSPGVLIVRAREGEVDIAAGPGEYYTVVVSDAGPSVFRDRRHDDPLRAQLILYNLTEVSPVALKTADGGTEVIPEISTGESASVAVNPVKARLALFSGGDRLADVGAIDMDSGQSYGIFTMERSGGPEVLVEQAEVDAK